MYKQKPTRNLVGFLMYDRLSALLLDCNCSNRAGLSRFVAAAGCAAISTGDDFSLASVVVEPKNGIAKSHTCSATDAGFLIYNCFHGSSFCINRTALF
jgi:hypothetical protein